MRRLGSDVRATLATLFRAPRPAGRRIAFPPRGHLVFGAVAAILVVAVTMALVDARSLPEMRRLPGGLVAVFAVITDFGLSGWFLWPIGIVMIAMAIQNTGTLPHFSRGVMASVAVRLGFVFTAIALPGLFVAIAKRLIGRARPPFGDGSPWTYAWFVWRPEYASFPSGHATTAFAAAVAIGALWPQARLALWTYAILIALSRVVITAHHPSDVVASAIVGTIGALLVRNWFAARRLGFALTADGSVRRLPGPSWRRIKMVARRLAAA